jgi:uncharacterized protein YPO0396
VIQIEKTSCACDGYGLQVKVSNVQVVDTIEEGSADQRNTTGQIFLPSERLEKRRRSRVNF